MSGGSMDYLYSKLHDAEFKTNSAIRQAFRTHLKKVAKALHDIEWVDSGDYGPGDEDESIRACLDSNEILESTIEIALKAIADFHLERKKLESEK